MKTVDPLLIDIEGFSGGQDRFDHDTLPEEQRLGVVDLNPRCEHGKPMTTAGFPAMFLFVNPTGKHGFELQVTSENGLPRRVVRIGGRCDPSLDPCRRSCAVANDACSVCFDIGVDDTCDAVCDAYTGLSRCGRR